VARTLASLGQYLASKTEVGVWLHLYAAAEFRWTQGGVPVRVRVETDYPWSGAIVVNVEPTKRVAMRLALRLPGWCAEPELRVNGEPVSLAAVTEDGYAVLEREWAPGDRVELALSMPIERVRAHPAVSEAAGQVALQRGPVVYAVEEVDCGAELAALRLPRDAVWRARHEPDLWSGVVVLEGMGRREAATKELYRTTTAATAPVVLRAVPYAWWNNRGEGEMRVWIHEC
jgi:hypothetical protein